jgi:hypothetical protein
MGEAGDEAKDCGRAVKRLVLLNHHLGSFDHGGDGIALLKFEFVGAAACDGTFNDTIPNPDDYMGHYVAQLNLFDRPTQFVSG